MSAIVASAKPCHGSVLAPIRMADAATASAPKSFLTRASAAGGYVPPSMRRTPSFPDTPKSVTSVNSSSHEEFPTLGGTPKSAVSGSASWTQIRTRFHPDTTGAPATPTPSTPGAASTNQFAALDTEPAPATPTSSASKVTNFKQVIEERIKREEAERLGLYEAEPTDPQLMTREQLERNGWAVLSLPPTEQGAARKAWFAEFTTRQAETEAAHKAREEMEEIMGLTYVPPASVPRAAATVLPGDYASEDDAFSVGPEEEDDGCDSIS
jgi:hypothetical protein